MGVLAVRVIAIGRRHAVIPVARHALERCLQVALCIDEEVGGDHDGFARRETFQDLDPISPAAPQRDLTWCEATRAVLHEHDLAQAAVEDCRARDRQDGLRRRILQLHGAEQPGPQVAARIGKGDPDIHRAGLGIEHRLDERHLAIEGVARQGHGLEAGGLPHRDVGGLGRRHLGHEPDR